MRAEREVLREEIDTLGETITKMEGVIARLEETYGQGLVTAPMDGIVTALETSVGGIVVPGEPLLRIHFGDRHVLAYVPFGTLFGPSMGDVVTISTGVSRFAGRISEILPLTEALPSRFLRRFEPPQRGRLTRISLDEGKTALPLFQQVDVSFGACL